MKYFTPAVSFVLNLLQLTSAIPHATRSCNTNGTLFVPEMHSYFRTPSGASFPRRSLHNTISVAVTEDRSTEWRQVAIFREVPAGATNCRLHFRAALSSQIWTSVVSGDIRIDSLSGLPAEGQEMLWENIEPLVVGSEIHGELAPALSVSLNGWDITEIDEQVIGGDGVGELECSEVMAFRVSMRDRGDGMSWGSFTIEQGVNIGLMMDYDC